ncbi:glycosyl transferase family 9 [Denitrovibrio acetiphilus DSM 12809]|uniref:Glycosyl transferase family 9 n=1 Tax=Denitrovibrio acetiphilus (strain DSM 12809 / NBRC 114555 / N2460) TaxID=522772 RepID=D4H6K4_DENA2|nr:glycosyltransferase family 9 protein [Denitrovibrio acetiphilus]ADD69678.1 glycosyl transferase family 9 [Denitrovibrio acetiphilus DSM 12809]
MKLLFVRFSSFGDVILTTGIMNYVSRMLPEAEIDVMTYKQYAPVFDNLPFVHNVIDYDRSKGLKEYLYVVQNETEDHDYIFDLHRKLRSVFLKFHSQAEYHHYKKDSKARRDFVRKGKDNPRLHMHVVQKYLEPVLSPLGLVMPDIDELRPVLIRHVERDEKRVFIHPFASKNTKTYPYARELAELLIKNGLTPVFAGMGKAPETDGIVDETGRKKLADMLDIIASCGSAVSSDSGPMHAAIGLGLPTVGIFGSTTKHFGFYPAFDNCIMLEDNRVNCRPCDVHGLDKCPENHFSCMKNLTPDKVLDNLKKLIGT